LQTVISPINAFSVITAITIALGNDDCVPDPEPSLRSNSSQKICVLTSNLKLIDKSSGTFLWLNIHPSNMKLESY